MTSIYFFREYDKNHGYMSNFYTVKFKDSDGVLFTCSEQYFMYYKCKLFDPLNTTLKNNIIQELGPYKIKKLGRQVKNYNEDIWGKLRYGIMLDALRCKFGQNPDLKARLKNTNDSVLYEASKYDKIWGIGYDAATAVTVDKSKYGQNLLGKALMQVRDE